MLNALDGAWMLVYAGGMAKLYSLDLHSCAIKEIEATRFTEDTYWTIHLGKELGYRRFTNYESVYESREDAVKTGVFRLTTNLARAQRLVELAQDALVKFRKREGIE